MKIIELRAENIKKLTVIHIKPDGHLVQITGPNGSGKSSVLDSILWALGGTKQIQFQPIRKGQETARVMLNLGEVIVTRRFSRAGGGSSITVENGDGACYRSPQKMLDDLVGELSFDPLAFSRMDQEAQFAELRKMVKLDVDIDELDLCNQEDYNTRAVINRQVKTLQVQVDNFGAIREDLPEQVIETNGLIEQLTQASSHNADIETARRKYAEWRDRTQGDAHSNREVAQTARYRAAELRRQADGLEKDAELADLQAKRLEDSLAEPPPAFGEPMDVQEIRRKIDDAQLINTAIMARDQYRRLQKSLADTKTEAEACTKRMDARTQQKLEAVANAKMPVEGLGFGEGMVLFNDLPFNQASQAEQLRISCAIAMAANPKLRVLRIQDGSLLDEKGLALLAAMAEQHDYQIWLERVDTTGKVGVVMEDGHIAGAEEETPKPAKTAKVEK